ncbi:MAG: hypothetical protein HY725_15580 [Candidatus Rokubacteria bacterium]|nr:hypothetical protein [Candidatus Rokubacteria bacterium]
MDAARPVLALEEWQSRTLEGVTLTPPERRLVARLQAEEHHRLGIDELRQGLRVTATSWVGVVRFEQFDLHITPKLAGNNLGLLELIEFTTGLGALQRLPGARELATEGSALLDLIGLLLADAAERLFNAGLYREYIEHDEDLPMVRGRILVAEQVLRHFGRVDRVACRFDEHDFDVLDNRLVAAALRLCGRHVADEGVRRRVRIVQDLFEQICEPDQLDVVAARQMVSYHRLNDHYRDAHTLAWLVIDGLGVRDLFDPGGLSCFAFLLDMNALFERFVSLLVAKLLGARGYRVRSQYADRSIILTADTNRPYGRVVPDLLIDRPGPPQERLAVDVKYKLYDERRLAPDDLYQAFLYAYAFKVGGSPQGARAVLIYPATRGLITATRLRVLPVSEPSSAEITAVGIAIPAALAEAKTARVGPVSEGLLKVLVGSPTAEPSSVSRAR